MNLKSAKRWWYIMILEKQKPDPKYLQHCRKGSNEAILIQWYSHVCKHYETLKYKAMSFLFKGNRL